MIPKCQSEKLIFQLFPVLTTAHDPTIESRNRTNENRRYYHESETSTTKLSLDSFSISLHYTLQGRDKTEWHINNKKKKLT